jgi:LysM repeat protein
VKPTNGALVPAAHALIRRLSALGTCLVFVSAAAACEASHKSAHKSATSTSPSTSAAQSTTTTTTPYTVYRLKHGDTLTAIANRYRVTVAAILSANHLKNPDRVTAGQTLHIPPAPPIGLVVKPNSGSQGDAFSLRLTGVPPSETITFEIDSPKGKYKGASHTPTGDGIVTATYQTALTDPTGTYAVKANGNEGTSAQTSFVVTDSGLTPQT